MISTPVLRIGDTGDAVMRLQGLVGAYPDGQFGPATEAAVRAAQRAQGLVADGIAGKKTWETLLRGMSAPPVDVPTFTASLIAKGFPLCKDPGAWADAFNGAVAKFPSFNRLGWACMLAKANTEAGGLTRWDENLVYTSADQVKRMFGSRAGANPAALLRNPKLLGDTVYAALGGYDGRGLGIIQLTGLENHNGFAVDMDMTLAEARAYMQTIPGAAMTAPWYLKRYGAVEAANRGDMRAVLAVVAGKTITGMSGIWTSIHGDQQMADYERFKALLSA